MKTKIAVMGCCATRDVFRTYYNNYKKDYEIEISVLRSSFFSILQSPIKLKDDDLTIDENDILKKNKDFHRRNLICMEDDFKKTFLQNMQEDIEYVIFDLYFDVVFGAIILDDNIILTNNTWSLNKIKYMKNNNFSKKVLNYWVNQDEYLELFKSSFDDFYNYMKNNFPNTKLILNQLNFLSRVLKENGETYIDNNFEVKSRKYNEPLFLLQDWIVNNYDICTVEFPPSITNYEKQIWGKGLVHFTDIYYKYVYDKIKLIVLQNKLEKKIINELSPKSKIDNNYLMMIDEIYSENNKEVDNSIEKISHNEKSWSKTPAIETRFNINYVKVIKNEGVKNQQVYYPSNIKLSGNFEIDLDVKTKNGKYISYIFNTEPTYGGSKFGWRNFKDWTHLKFKRTNDKIEFYINYSKEPQTVSINSDNQLYFIIRFIGFNDENEFLYKNLTIYGESLLFKDVFTEL